MARDGEDGGLLDASLDAADLDWLLEFTDLNGEETELLTDGPVDTNLSAEAQEEALKPTPKARKKRSWDPNKARKARAAEVRELRHEVEMLEERLRVLKLSKRGGRTMGFAQPRVWEAIWCKQLERRELAEAENRRLLSCLQAQAQEIKSLKRLMAQSHRTLHQTFPGFGAVNGFAQDTDDQSMDAMVFAELLAGVDASFNQIDLVFELNGVASANAPYRSAAMRTGDSGIFLDVGACNILPFNVDMCADVIWQYYRGNDKHRGPLYYKSAEIQDHELHQTVIEKFAISMGPGNMRIDLRTRQVLRRYTSQDDRVIIVWMSRIEPAEFAHRPFTTFGFRENGFVVCRPASPGGTSHTLLQRCYRVFPFQARSAGRTLKDTDARKIVDFYLRLDNTSVHQQLFENALMQRAIQA